LDGSDSTIYIIAQLIWFVVDASRDRHKVGQISNGPTTDRVDQFQALLRAEPGRRPEPFAADRGDFKETAARSPIGLQATN
jgi:hypothetical protein